MIAATTPGTPSPTATSPSWGTWAHRGPRGPIDAQPDQGQLYPTYPAPAPIVAPPVPSGYNVSPLSAPVPDGTPTDELYTAPDGSVWQYNPSVAEWQEVESAGYVTQQSSAQYGTPVPVGYPTNEIYTDANGNEWEFTNGQWEQIVAGQATAQVSASVTAGSWFSDQTLIPGVSNGLIAGAGALALLFMFSGSGKKR